MKKEEIKEKIIEKYGNLEEKTLEELSNIYIYLFNLNSKRKH